MKEWIILLDLDGTLLKNDSYSIDLYTIKVIKKLTELNHHIIINTGRPPRATQTIYRMLEIDTPVSCYNSSYIFFPSSEEIINNITIDKNIALQIVNEPFIQKNTKCILVEAHNEPHLNNNSYTIFNECWLNYSNEIFVGKIQECKEDINGIYFETIINIPIVEYNKRLNKFSDYISFRVWREIKNSSSVIINVFPKGITKRFAVDFFARYYGLNPKNVMAIGDGSNDYDVIKHSGVGVAMKNGHPKIKKIAKYTTEFTNEEAGVGKFLAKFFKLNNL